MRLAVAVALLFLSPVTQAQLTSGVKAGVNLSSLRYSSGGSMVGSSDLVSFHAGLFAKLRLSEKYGVHTDFLYSSQGGSSQYLGDCTLGYFAMPVLFAYSFAPGATIGAGLQPSFLLSANIGGRDFKEVFNEVDCGLVFSVDIQGPVGTNFSLRYISGLMDLSKSYASYLFGYSPTDFAMSNRVIQLSVGYALSKDR